MNNLSYFSSERSAFHNDLKSKLLTLDEKGIPSNADKDGKVSVDISKIIADKIGNLKTQKKLPGQQAGNVFEKCCMEYINLTFSKLRHLRPGSWHVKNIRSRNELEIAEYYQYTHLIALSSAAKNDPELSAALGSDYIISPDIVIYREPESDARINKKELLVDSNSVKHASLRESVNKEKILHASISCKWTMRSDRAQNSRSEALNLIRNRKGRLPHIVVVIGEPLPSRIASIALGTGDIDCVYHFALYELIDAVNQLENEMAIELVDTLVNGKRLKDISDLPFDLAV